jgi:uncharacterized protein (TIGR00266 family)
MEIQIHQRPASTFARVRLQAGEQITSEVGAMISMTSGFQVTTSSRNKSSGGFFKGVRRMFAGENFFLNHFVATAPDQEVLLAPILMGDILQFPLDGTLIVQGTSFLASTFGIDIDATWQGFANAMLSGESMFWLKCQGQGDLLINSFGAIYEINVNGGYTVDSGHIVAFEDTLQFRIGQATNNLVGSFLSGEGLVCKFSGQGKLYCQTHHPRNFGRLLGPKLKPRQE